MSEQTVIKSIGQLPILPEKNIIEPIVQCGVLYVGSAIPSPGLRGLDSVQEPFSHRYPVDGTNTVQGIDSILSIYDNGIQITFARQPHVVIFFPISSLIYCASLRFSVVENDQTSSIDWRFITIDSTIQTQSKHPPLFCAVVHRTQILTGDECHCFITKNDDSALTLVRVISEVYAKIKPNTKPIRSPIFYQLDRYGRKISETNGVIYLSPATDDEYQSNDHDGSISSIKRNYLLDPSVDGFFYRTDANIIEQWQLWDDDDIVGSRPRPPPSPFGQHQGIYHDDLTHEIHQYLRQMDDEERSSVCSCSSSSSSSTKHRRRHRHRHKSRYNTDQFHESFSHSQASTFNPSLVSAQKAPIIIEKVVPNPMIALPQTSPQYVSEQPQQSPISPNPVQQTNVNYMPYSNTYQVNEHGEKITQEGNRIVFMDVVQPSINNTKNEAEQYITPTSRSHSHQRRRRSKRIPVIDLRSIENFINKEKSKQRQKDDNDSDDHYLSTSDVLELVEGYFEDYKGKKIELNSDDADTMLKNIEASSKKIKHRRSKSSHNEARHGGHSVLTSGPSINYVERPTIIPPPVFNSDPVNEYVTKVYGTSEKTEHETQPPAVNDDEANQNYMSPFRYMQSSVNPLLLREYRNAYYQA